MLGVVEKLQQFDFTIQEALVNDDLSTARPLFNRAFNFATKTRVEADKYFNEAAIPSESNQSLQTIVADLDSLRKMIDSLLEKMNPVNYKYGPDHPHQFHKHAASSSNPLDDVTLDELITPWEQPQAHPESTENEEPTSEDTVTVMTQPFITTGMFLDIPPSSPTTNNFSFSSPTSVDPAADPSAPPVPASFDSYSLSDPDDDELPPYDNDRSLTSNPSPIELPNADGSKTSPAAIDQAQERSLSQDLRTDEDISPVSQPASASNNG